MSDIAREVNRVMANPEIGGNPVALDFSKGKSAIGFTKNGYANEYDRIFSKKKTETGKGTETVDKSKNNTVKTDDSK
jgi:hypothetical protein